MSMMSYDSCEFVVIAYILGWGCAWLGHGFGILQVIMWWNRVVGDWPWDLCQSCFSVLWSDFV